MTDSEVVQEVKEIAESLDWWQLVKRKKSILIFLLGAVSSVLFLLLFSSIKNKPTKFLIQSDIQIRYDPLEVVADRNPKNPQPLKKSEEDNIQEALMNLRVALELRKQGKFEKAFRIFQHSHALAPNHPAILTEYGIFLELYRNDVVMADRMYFRALTFDPNYERALTNRQRTAIVVENLDEERLRRLDEKRDLLAQVDSNSAAMNRATKEAYILHIYHSVGIEGNSMTLSETRSVLETRMAVSGRSIDEHNEIIGLDSAMKYVNASLVK